MSVRNYWNVGVCLLVLSCSIHITKGQLVSVRNYWNGGCLSSCSIHITKRQLVLSGTTGTVDVCLLVLSCSIHITKGQLVSVRNYWNGGCLSSCSLTETNCPLVMCVDQERTRRQTPTVPVVPE